TWQPSTYNLNADIIVVVGAEWQQFWALSGSSYSWFGPGSRTCLNWTAQRFDIADVPFATAIPMFLERYSLWILVTGLVATAVEAGPSTGWSPPEALLEAGAAGTLINHSERKVAWEEMAKSIPRCQELGLEVVACADDISEAETLAKLSPEYIAIEPPELIGGEVSVTTAKPEVISRAVDRIHAVNPKVVVLCGAGVRTRKDVARALELGTSGVLLETGVVKAKDPEGALRNLIKGLPSGAPRPARSR